MTQPDDVLMTPAQREEFERWAQTVSLAIVKCRVHGHDFPDWDDRRSKVTRDGRTGSFTIVAPCKRKCGVVNTRYVSSDGYLNRRNKLQLDYSEAMPRNRDPLRAYLMPRGARTGHGYTREQRAMFRRELLERGSEWITEE